MPKRGEHKEKKRKHVYRMCLGYCGEQKLIMEGKHICAQCRKRQDEYREPRARIL